MDNEVDLTQYLRVLWRRRYIIGGVTLTAILVAGLVSFFLPAIYEARAMLLVTRPSVQVGTPPDPRIPGLKIGGVLGEELQTETIVAFAGSDAITRKVADKMSEGTADESRLAGRLKAEAVRNTSLVLLKMRGRDPQYLARVVNAWATIVAVESEAIFSAEARQAYTIFDSGVSRASEHLSRAEDAQRRFNASSRIGLLQARVNALTNQVATYESRLIDLAVNLGKAETELAQTEIQIRRQPKTLTLLKSITTDPFMQQAVSATSRQEFAELAKLKLRSEELNPVYMTLDQVKSNLAIQVGALRAERVRVSRAIAELTAELSDLRDQLAAQQLLQTQLTRAVTNATQVYDVLVQRREETRVAAGGNTGMVRLAAQAIVSRDPVAPRKGLNVVIATLLGLVVGTLLALGVEYLGSGVSAPASHTTSVAPADPGSRGIQRPSI